MNSNAEKVSKRKVKPTSKNSIRKSPEQVEPKRSKDIFVTQGQFDSFRSENKSEHTTLSLEIRNLSKNMNAKFKAMDAKFEAKFGVMDAKFGVMDAKFGVMDAKFEAMDAKFESRFDAMDAKFEAMRGDMHSMMMKMDEQNSRNKFVLDGYANLYERQEVVESKVDENLNIIRAFIQANRR